MCAYACKYVCMCACNLYACLCRCLCLRVWIHMCIRGWYIFVHFLNLLCYSPHGLVYSYEDMLFSFPFILNILLFYLLPIINLMTLASSFAVTTMYSVLEKYSFHYFFLYILVKREVLPSDRQ